MAHLPTLAQGGVITVTQSMYLYMECHKDLC